MIRRRACGSRVPATLLLLLLLLVPACDTVLGQASETNTAAPKLAKTASDAEINRAARGEAEESAREKTPEATTQTKPEVTEAGEPRDPEETADPKQPGETSSKGDAEGFPEYRDFYSEGDPKTPTKLVSSNSSTGAIPAVKPFNFGRDPGGPEDKTLYLTIPKIGLTGMTVFDTVSDEKLAEGTIHIPVTGYPWQKGANVYIAGHRVGYPNTVSYYLFFRLDELAKGDKILLEDSAGRQYLYRVTRQLIVGPDNAEVMNPVEGKSLVTLQTCTLPDYERRLIVQGELVEKES